MFKAVSGPELKDFDEETRKLYSKRESDVRYTEALLRNPRTYRNYLPVVANGHPYLQEKESYLASLPWKMAAGMGFFTFATYQFSKAFYPYGIILRKSIPTTPMQQLAFKGPMTAVFVYWWWCVREAPRSQLMDMTCDTE